MMVTRALYTFGGAELSNVQYHTLLNILVLTGALLLIGAIHGRAVRNRLPASLSRYAVGIGSLVQLIAALSYVAITARLILGYQMEKTAHGIVYMATQAPILQLPARYIDWAITVPLLVVEMLAISALAIQLSQRLRAIGVVAAFLMIFCGYLGSTGYLFPTALSSRLGWGGISSVFFVIVYAILIYASRKAIPELGKQARRSYKIAFGVLLVVWFVYPIVYVLTGYTTGGGWALTLQGILSVADLISKVGFGLLIQRVALSRLKEAAQTDVSAAITQ